MTPPFSAVSKHCDPPSVSTPFPPANFWQVPKYEEEKRIADYESRCLRKRDVILSVAAVAEIVKIKGTLI